MKRQTAEVIREYGPFPGSERVNGVSYDGNQVWFADGSKVQVYYPGVATLARRFAPEFRLRAVKGVGIFVPPSYTSSFVAGHPSIIKFAERSDLLLAHCPGLRVLGDHILLTFERTS